MEGDGFAPWGTFGKMSGDIFDCHYLRGEGLFLGPRDRRPGCCSTFCNAQPPTTKNGLAPNVNSAVG